MRIYVTRHGQPVIGDLPAGANHEFPPGDPSLTELGTVQATYLGNYLKLRNFKGKVYSSPYRRTLYTAQEVAQITETNIYPEKMLQEYVTKAGKPDIKTSNLPSIKQLITNIATDSNLDDEWLFAGPESVNDVKKRVKPFIDYLLNSNEDEALLVGHGASVGACKVLLFEAGEIPYIDEYNWNCSLSEFVIEQGKTTAVELNCDISFMPEKIITSNLMKYNEREGIR
ncbi:MAG: phosphoglycerate mutase family protein [Victivallaceae bacterium]|nr:phosphoglycerate mutase family protein [Victivallaceae bacterium]